MLNIEGLKLFTEVASKGSISKVAESTHYSQPAISQQIKRLEEAIGYDLFTRSNKGVELTEAGEIVNKYAKNIVRSYYNLLEDLSAIESSFSIIRINCTPIISTYALPCTVYSINNSSNSAMANYKLETYTNRSDEIESNIANGTFDLGIIICEPGLKSLTSARITTDTLVPVVSPKYRLPEGEMSVEKLAEADLILPSDKFRVRRKVMEWFSEAGYDTQKLKVSTSMDEIESIKSMVDKGYGISFLPYLAIKKELYTKQLKKIEIEGFELKYEIFLIYKPSRLEDLGFRDFVKTFKRTAQKTFC